MEPVTPYTFYECSHFEYEYDDLGKFCWCHNRNNPSTTCEVDYKYCMQFCPYYKKNLSRPITIILTDYDRERMSESKRNLAAWKKQRASDRASAAKSEYETYLRLKKKYENKSNRKKG